MATWFAQTTGNINAANQWNSNPGGGGTVLTWPPASGDVLVANGKIVTINVNTNLGAAGEIRNDTTGGATSGGYFQYAPGVSLTANVMSGNTASWCLLSAVSGFLVGMVTGGIGKSGVQVQNSSGTFAITGEVYGGSGTSGYGVNSLVSGSGVLTVTGNVTGGSGSICYGLNHESTGTVNITGNSTGANAGGSNRGVHNNAAGTINIIGNSISGAVNFGARNNSTGTLSISGFAQASSGAAGADNIAQGILQVGETRSASNGRGAVTGAFRFASATAAKDMPYTPDGQISMTVLDVAAIVPAESDVRKGLIYGDGAYTGTLPLGRNRTSMAGRF
jgi:hypothetical protein